MIMTGDEEDVGQPRDLARRGVAWSLADAADVAIGFEDGPGDPRPAVIARRGSTGWTLQVARPRRPLVADLPRGRRRRRDLRGSTGAAAVPGAAVGGAAAHVQPGRHRGRHGGDIRPRGSRGTAAGKSNVIAAQAVVEGDVRAISHEQLASAKAAMQAIVADALPHARATLEFDDSYPPFAPTDGNRRLLSMYDQASRDIGAGPVGAGDPRRAGAADISFIAGRVEMALDGIGLMGRNDHSEQETADLADAAVADEARGGAPVPADERRRVGRSIRGE